MRNGVVTRGSFIFLDRIELNNAKVVVIILSYQIRASQARVVASGFSDFINVKMLTAPLARSIEVTGNLYGIR